MNACHKCGKQSGAFYTTGDKFKLICEECKKAEAKESEKKPESDPFGVWSVF